VKKTILYFILFNFCIAGSFAQFKPLETKLIVSDSINQFIPREKIFVHYDKPNYSMSDTIWLKGYILRANDNVPVDSSRIAYVEIIDTDKRVVKRISTPCFMGFFSGSIPLVSNEFKQGAYIMRSYTNYMRNFGDSLFFESKFKIIDVASDLWKNNTDVSEKNNDKNGSAADKENKRDSKRKDKNETDLQFLPEGGKLVAGKLQKIGFKAIDKFAKGTDVKGIIKNSKGADIVAFASIYKGIGSVSFTPEWGETYSAYLDDGTVYPLPKLQSSGTLLQVSNNQNVNSFTITVDGTNDMINKPYYITTTLRGMTAVKGVFTLRDKPYKLEIPKDDFPQGIYRVTLYDANYLPMNERIIFIRNNNEDLTMSVKLNKPEFGQRDSVHVSLKTGNAEMNPMGTFSATVLDTSMVKVSKYQENILSYILFSSDLKGEIEDPYFYLNTDNSEIVDALMLTQGWVDYNRENIEIKYPYEKEFTITGTVDNLINKPQKNTKVSLFSKIGKNGAVVMDTITDNNGFFEFNQFPYFMNDSVSMLVQALNKNNKAFNAFIDVDLPVYPKYTKEINSTPLINLGSDTIAKEYADDQKEVLAKYGLSSLLLDEIVVSAPAMVAGSKNLNDDSGADQVITANYLKDKAGSTLLDILTEEVSGFGVGFADELLQYTIGSYKVYFVINGVDMHSLYVGFDDVPVGEGTSVREYLQYFTTMLEGIRAEDIEGIEVMTSTKNKMRYIAKYLPFDKQSMVEDKSVFIEVTTHSYTPFYMRTTNKYVYKPLIPVISKSFYTPKYVGPRQDAELPDLRNTIYWNPNIITDKNGEAEFSFYTSDSEGDYILILQGVDLTGNMGLHFETVKINNNSNIEE
jgi:hypothetical protein